jgi:predicted DNA-binding helix-hairpin-helix protein
LGVKAVGAILKARRYRSLRLADIARLTRSIERLRPFIVAADWRPVALGDSAGLRARLVRPKRAQLELFA